MLIKENTARLCAVMLKILLPSARTSTLYTTSNHATCWDSQIGDVRTASQCFLAYKTDVLSSRLHLSRRKGKFIMYNAMINEVWTNCYRQADWTYITLCGEFDIRLRVEHSDGVQQYAPSVAVLHQVLLIQQNDIGKLDLVQQKLRYVSLIFFCCTLTRFLCRQTCEAFKVYLLMLPR